METHLVKSATNPFFKKLKSLKSRSGRRKHGLFTLEGLKVIAEARELETAIVDIVVNIKTFDEDEFSRHLPGVERVVGLDDILFSELSDTTTSSGVLAIARMKNEEEDELFTAANPLVVIVDSIQDPGNLGTILRSARGLGASGVILTKGTVDLYNSKVVRAASGAIFSQPLLTEKSFAESLQLVKSRGLQVIALSPEATERITDCDLTGPCALIAGNEGQGISSHSESMADRALSIPLASGSESLNVATAAAIALYEASRQRGVLESRD